MICACSQMFLIIFQIQIKYREITLNPMLCLYYIYYTSIYNKNLVKKSIFKKKTLANVHIYQRHELPNTTPYMLYYIQYRLHTTVKYMPSSPASRAYTKYMYYIKIVYIKHAICCVLPCTRTTLTCFILNHANVFIHTQNTPKTKTQKIL